MNETKCPNCPDSQTLGTTAQSPPDDSEANPTAQPRPESNAKSLIDNLTQAPDDDN